VASAVFLGYLDRMMVRSKPGKDDIGSKGL
jgi:hypothetical protein